MMLGGVPQTCIMRAVRPSETLILAGRVAPKLHNVESKSLILAGKGDPKLHNVGRQIIGNFDFAGRGAPKLLNVSRQTIRNYDVS